MRGHDHDEMLRRVADTLEEVRMNAVEVAASPDSSAEEFLMMLNERHSRPALKLHEQHDGSSEFRRVSNLVNRSFD